MSRSTVSDSRRSSRVPLQVVISLQDNTQRTCDGETEIVNLHGALIHTTIELPYRAEISIHVQLTGKSAKARIIYVNPLNRLLCGIELDRPQNIWGVPLPPPDWTESSAFNAKH
jgi:hypothetical protein